MRYLLLLWAAAGALSAAMTPLYNGRNLDGWIHEGPRATFSAADAELRTSGAGNWPNWLRTAREYENFRLEFEYKLEQWAQAGVYLRAPREGRPARSGIAIVLAHDFHKGVVDDHVTGAVLGALPPQNPQPGNYGQWHKVEILLDGERLRVTIDGTVMQDAALGGHPELRYRLKRGYIGFPDLGHPWALRNVWIEDLGARLKYVELFDGRTLDGWQLRDGGHWSARDGAVVGANGHGILYAPGVFGDFELTLAVRTRNHVNSGIFLRGEPAGRRRGFEIQVYSPPDGVDYTTGSIYGLVRARPVADHDDRWLLVQVRLQGRRCVVRLDGETVAETDAFPETQPGRIGFQIHVENASVEYREIRVRPL